MLLSIHETVYTYRHNNFFKVMFPWLCLMSVDVNLFPWCIVCASGLWNNYLIGDFTISSILITRDKKILNDIALIL